MKEIARFSKNCAIKCTQATREALSSANAGLENNAEYITWFLPEEDMPEFEPKTDPTLYVSSDYQKDRTVRVLKKAASGNGINVILMGDGYSDRMIADGTYDKDMELAMAQYSAKSLMPHSEIYLMSIWYTLYRNVKLWKIARLYFILP